MRMLACAILLLAGAGCNTAEAQAGPRFHHLHNGGAAAAAAFAPSDLTDAIITLQCDLANLYQDDGCSTPVASDGDPIGCLVDDQSQQWTQSTSAKRPLYKTGVVNGKSACRFDGSDDLLVHMAELSTASTGSINVVYAFAAAPAQNNNTNFCTSSTTNNSRWFYVGGERSAAGCTDDPFVAHVSGTNFVCDASSNYTEAWHSVHFSSNGSAFAFEIDGTAQVIDVGTDNGVWLDDTGTRDNWSIGALKRTTEINHAAPDIRSIQVTAPTVIAGSDLTDLESWINTDTAISFAGIDPERKWKYASIADLGPLYAGPVIRPLTTTYDQRVLACIPAAKQTVVNNYLETQGYGPDNFSIPVIKIADQDSKSPRQYCADWQMTAADKALLEAAYDANGMARNLIKNRLSWDPREGQTIHEILAADGDRVRPPEE